MLYPDDRGAPLDGQRAARGPVRPARGGLEDRLVQPLVDTPREHVDLAAERRHRGTVLVVVGRRRRRELGRGDVQVIGVDVDGRAAPGLVVVALVLLDPLVVRPVGVGDHRVGHGGDAVPAGEPDIVGPGLEGGAVVDADQVADPGADARVDARQVAQLVQPCRPAAQEGEHRLAAGGVGGGVGLHVEVDGAAGADPQQAPAGHRVLRGGPALRPGGGPQRELWRCGRSARSGAPRSYRGAWPGRTGPPRDDRGTPRGRRSGRRRRGCGRGPPPATRSAPRPCNRDRSPAWWLATAPGRK